MREDQVDLLALCRIKGLSWYLIAREGRRPNGLSRLLRGRLTEQSKDADKARVLLASSLPQLDELRAGVRDACAGVVDDGIALTSVLDDDYPLNLRTIFNAPPFLFYRGRLHADLDARSVAVVGTRKPTDEGVHLASKMARLLSENSVTVLSGLARGIDTAAHRATLDAGGRTVAVLGSGIRRIYPKENAALADEIAGTGAIVSQFWPDGPPATYTFPRRNVTMSGFAQGTVVIEAGATSGAKMQARLALEHGKKVFLIRRLVTHQEWAKRYLHRGAFEVRDVEGIVGRLRTPDDIRARSRDAHQLALSLAE